MFLEPYRTDLSTYTTKPTSGIFRSILRQVEGQNQRRTSSLATNFAIHDAMCEILTFLMYSCKPATPKDLITNHTFKERKRLMNADIVFIRRDEIEDKE